MPHVLQAEGGPLACILQQKGIEFHIGHPGADQFPQHHANMQRPIFQWQQAGPEVCVQLQETGGHRLLREPICGPLIETSLHRLQFSRLGCNADLGYNGGTETVPG